MARGPEARASALLARQRSAVRRLKRDLFGSDGSLRHPYFRDLRREISAPFRRVSPVRLAGACRSADVVYVGDFHADPSCQRVAADLLESMASKRRVVLGVEFVYTRQQETLDRRQEGSIDDRTFLRRIHYREEWGYPWDGYRDLLDRARKLGVPVIALDRPPRGGFDGLRRRDAHAARAIATLLTQQPRSAVLVLFGESHLARLHVPREVDRLLSAEQGRVGARSRCSRIPSRSTGPRCPARRPFPEAVRFEGGAFAVLHTPPLARYETYRQVLERWRGETPPDEDVDLTPAVHHLDRHARGLDGHPPRPASRSPSRRLGGRSDGTPTRRSTAGPRRASSWGLSWPSTVGSRVEIRDARRMLVARDALYDARSNTVFLVRYLPGPAAGEAARFLRVALSGRLHRDAEVVAADAAERTYGAAYNEALAYLGARLVDPASDLVSGPDEAPAGEQTDPTRVDRGAPDLRGRKRRGPTGGAPGAAARIGRAAEDPRARSGAPARSDPLRAGRARADLASRPACAVHARISIPRERAER